MKRLLCVMLSLFVLVSLIGCGNSLNSSSSQVVGADVIQQYNLQIQGPENTTSITLPMAFTDPDWALKESLCQQAGYDLSPYAGQEVSLTQYELAQKYRIILQVADIGGTLTSQNIELALSLCIISRNNKTIGCYIAVEDSTVFEQFSQAGVIPGRLLAITDQHIR